MSDVDGAAPGDALNPCPAGVGEDVCPACSGKGLIDGQPCEHCLGRGKILVEIAGA